MTVITVTMHRVVKTEQTNRSDQWIIYTDRDGVDLKPLKSVRGIDRAIGRRAREAQTWREPPRLVYHVVGPDLDVWCRVIVSMSLRGGLSIYPIAERVDGVVLLDDAKDQPA